MMDGPVVGVLIATLLFLITLVYVLLKRAGGKAKKDTVMLTGLSGAGKTAMYTRMITHRSSPSYTSMSENVCSNVLLVDGAPPVTLLDVPGNDRVRKPRLTHWLSNAAQLGSIKSIIVCVDSSSFGREARDVAELVYDVLARVPRRLPVLLAANKHDMPMAKSGKLISTQLAKEMQLLHVSRLAAVKMSDDDAKSSLLPVDEKFSWETLDRNVTFVECSSEGGDGLHTVLQWLTQQNA